MGILLDRMVSMLGKLSPEELEVLKKAVDETHLILFPNQGIVKEVEQTIILNSEKEVVLELVVEKIQEINQHLNIDFLELVGFEPSEYQKNIVDFILNSTENGIINAVAGSGKTSTLKLIAKVLESLGWDSKDIKVLVFGKENQKDIIKKFPTSWKDSIQTLHSIGLSLIKDYLPKGGKYQIESWKYKSIAEEMEYLSKSKRSKSYVEQEGICKDYELLKLVDLLRLNFLEPTEENIRIIVEHHNLENVWDVQKLAPIVNDILVDGEVQGRDYWLDYTDMLWLPCKWQVNNEKSFKTYKMVLVDEGQDLNVLQRNIVKMLSSNGGRVLGVLDKFQSILGFCGASSNSAELLKEDLKAVELPLSICYRCCKEAISLVNQLFPNIPIKAADNAIDGIVGYIDREKMESLLSFGDLIISRKTAPLVDLCIRLISQGKPAKVKGKDIGEGVKKDIEEISKIKGFKFEEFENFLQKFKQLKMLKIQYAPNKEDLENSLNDKLTGIMTIYRSCVEATSINDLNLKIDSIFSDDNAPITLMTCHKSKGAEADRVFIIDYKNLPMVYKNQLEWMKEQEDNLHYVALTRAKKELYLIED